MFTVLKNDLSYPPLLHKISDPPAKLFALGQALNPHDRYLAVVGTRRPSRYGMQMAEEFAGALAAAGLVIVSGLAYGIDGTAHRAALKAGGKTLAVLGGGLHHITPRAHVSLAREIQKTGTLLTEYPPDLSPHKGTFPRRNRIIAGMCCATLVIEAPEISGALITARLALEANREVFVLPANITQEASRGSNRLICEGAAFPVTSTRDILRNLGMEQSPQAPQEAKNPPLPQDEAILLALLKNAPLTLDQLIKESGLPAGRCTALVSLLELKDRVETFGAYVCMTR